MLFNNDIFICKSKMNIMKFCYFTCYALSVNFSKSYLLNRPLDLLMPIENTSPVEVSPINDIDFFFFFFFVHSTMDSSPNQ